MLGNIVMTTRELLTHCGPVMIYLLILIITGADNGLPPNQHQAAICTNDD